MNKRYEFEKGLIGKRVSVRAYNWDDRVTGELIKYNQYFFVLRLDDGQEMIILRRSAGKIKPIEDSDEETK